MFRETTVHIYLFVGGNISLVEFSLLKETAENFFILKIFRNENYPI